MKLYHIVRTDGYSIDSLGLTSDAKEATSIMKNDYTAHMPDSLEESEDEMSYRNHHKKATTSMCVDEL